MHEQLDTVRPITKWAHRVLDPAEIPQAVHEAFYQLKTGRPRPVEIEIPPETLAEEADIELREPGDYRRGAASDESVQNAARLLAGAEKPLIWAGGGAISSGASEVLTRLAEHLQAPVVTTGEGKGAISDRHYLSLGVPRAAGDPLANEMQKHDLVLAVGTRLAVPSLLSGQVVQVDIDAEEIGRNYENTVGVVGDARLTLEALYKAISTAAPPRPSRQSEVEVIKARIASRVAQD